MMRIANLSRGSVFAAGFSTRRGFSLGAYSLGQTAEQWYDRARRAVDTFAEFLKMVEGLPAAQRQEVLIWVGKANDPASPRYRYFSVLDDIRTVEAKIPPNYSVYDVGRRQTRVTKLEEFNKLFPGRIGFSQFGAPPSAGPTVTAAPTAAPSGGIPTWGYVAGGVAIAGLIALLAT